MPLKLHYDPKRAVRLRKNELLNELRSRFSQNLFDIFKKAESSLWKEEDENFDFLNVVFEQLYGELDNLQEELKGKAEAWSSVAKAENKSNSNISIKKSENISQNLDFAAQQEIVPYTPAKTAVSTSVNPKPKTSTNANAFSFPSQSKSNLGIEENEFDFFEEF
ncbi:MAG: hypothetical protein SFU25_07365 [Candidatus Caenarcaniphilales bacterium]|nr:hypothetical protein [Candidatus Caenarcaniphilales bacterium]